MRLFSKITNFKEADNWTTLTSDLDSVLQTDDNNKVFFVYVLK